jgi:hypothetical protein
MLEFKELRWWSLEEIEKSREEFAPRSLAGELRKLIELGPPKHATDVGV